MPPGGPEIIDVPITFNKAYLEKNNNICWVVYCPYTYPDREYHYLWYAGGNPYPQGNSGKNYPPWGSYNIGNDFQIKYDYYLRRNQWYCWSKTGDPYANRRAGYQIEGSSAWDLMSADLDWYFAFRYRTL